MAVSNNDLLKLQDVDYLRGELGIEVKWRVLTTKGGIARIVAYQDARDVQEVLDKVCGPQNWSNEPRNINGKLYMVVGINTQEEGWVYKADVGVESNVAKEKGESSDAFKRASVMWGIFRDNYERDYVILQVARDGKTPLTPEGIRLETPAAISAYCNGINSSMGFLKSLYKSMKNDVDNDGELLEAFSIIKKHLK